MTKHLRIFGFIGVGILMGLTAFGIFYTAQANPSFFLRSSSTSATFPAATSTQAFFARGGVSTTTLVLDLGAGAAQGGDSAVLLVQFTSTTSQPVLNIDIQYSQDAIDWYASPVGMDFQSYASSTPSLGQIQTLQLPFASSTIDRGAVTANAGVASTTTRVVNIKVPTRYVRAVNYVAPGTNTAALLWEEFVAKRQAP